MAKINLSISNKTDKVTQKAAILFRFVGGRGLIFRVKSGLYINPERWHEKDNRVIIPRLITKEQKELVKLQKQLDELSNVILETFTSTDKATISKMWIEKVIKNYHFPEADTDKEQSFFEIFDEFLLKRKISEVRKRNFRVVYRAMQRYELYKQAVLRSEYTLDVNTINSDTLRDIEVFLKQEYTLHSQHTTIYEAIPESRIPQPRGQNTINGIFAKLRTLYIWAIDTEKTTNNPFKNFFIEECVYGTPYYITIEERKKLYNTDMADRPQLAIQRDIFVFQCLIGCRVGDFYKMTINNIINGAIEYIPRKTKDGRPITVRVPLNDTAKEILSRYSTSQSKKLLPFISEQKYNIAIKAAFKKSNMTRMITTRNPTTGDAEIRPLNEIASSHLARRCFVGNLYKKVKDPNLVGALSGHKEGSKAFARYRDIDEDMKNELIKLLD